MSSIKKKKLKMTDKQLARKARRMIYNVDAEELSELSVSEIARRLDVHRSRLSRAYRKHFGRTVQGDLQASKIVNFDILVCCGEARNVQEALDILDIRDRRHFNTLYMTINLYSLAGMVRKYGTKD
ncbi:MAG: hypothetical protein GY940_44490 [bacterium]|nr:hypothetical protein [bacterium]